MREAQIYFVLMATPLTTPALRATPPWRGIATTGLFESLFEKERRAINEIEH